MTSYGDIISNINISKQIKFFLKKKLVAVISAVSVPSRFGILKMDNNKLVKSFDEKPNIKSQKINGGFFVFSHKIFTYIKNEKNSLEGIPMTLLSKQRQLAAYMHSDFWQPIDNMKDKLSVEKIIKKINFYKNVK